MRRAFRSTTARMAIAGVIALTALGALAYAGAQPRSLETSPEEFLESIGLEVQDLEEGGEENGDTEDGFDPAPLREGSVASEHASQTAIDVLTVIEAWRNGEFDSGCEFGQAVAAAARGDDDEENGENGDDAFDPCEREGSNGEEASAAGRAKGEEMSAAGKAKGQAAAEAGKAKGAEAAGAARGRGAPGGGASNGGGGGGSGPPSDPGPPPGAGPPGGTPGGP